MKFLCIPCDAVMAYAERQVPGDGTMAAVFTCATCGHEMAMLTNPMETQLVSSLGVKIGGRTVPAQPLEGVRSSLDNGRQDAFEAEPSAPGPVRWDDEAVERLARVPTFVRGMVKRIYTDWAREQNITLITVAEMDRARTELGLEGM